MKIKTGTESSKVKVKEFFSWMNVGQRVQVNWSLIDIRPSWSLKEWENQQIINF